MPSIRYGWRGRQDGIAGWGIVPQAAVTSGRFGAVSFANRGIGMAGIFFILAVLLGGAALLFRNAAGEISIGTEWASDVCSTSQMFCQHPEYLAYAAGAVLVVAIGIKLGSAAN